MSTTGRAPVDDLVERWTRAERANNSTALEPLLTADFSAVGPAGFVLDRAGWLGRYSSGDLVNDSFEWKTASVRTYDGCAVVIGLQRQDTRYRGHPNPGEFRGTLLAVRNDDTWRLAALHLSPLGWRLPGMPAGEPPVATTSTTTDEQD